MSEYPWNEMNVTFIWLNSLYNSFKSQRKKKLIFFLNFKVKETFNVRKTYANPQIDSAD